MTLYLSNIGMDSLYTFHFTKQGQMGVTPATFAHLTHKVMSLAQGRVAVILEVMFIHLQYICAPNSPPPFPTNLKVHIKMPNLMFEMTYVNVSVSLFSIP